MDRIITVVCNFTDNTTFFTCDSDINFLAIKWFLNNYMKLNEDKCHLLVATKCQNIWAKTHDAKNLGI